MITFYICLAIIKSLYFSISVRKVVKRIVKFRTKKLKLFVRQLSRQQKKPGASGDGKMQYKAAINSMWSRTSWALLAATLVCLSEQKRVVIQKLKSKESTDIMKLWLGNSSSFSVHSIAVP